MTTILILLVVAIALGAVAYVAYQKSLSKPTQSKQLSAPVATGVRGLKAGDVVMYDNTDWVVEGGLRYTEDGYTWQEFLLADGERRQWLGVEDDEGLQVTLWDKAVAPELSDAAGEGTITHAGVTYTREERGTASWTGEGTQAGSGRVEYIDYQGPDGKLLGFERFGSGSWEANLGRVISENELDIYPSKETV